MFPHPGYGAPNLSSAENRESLRVRLRVALSLAISNSAEEALGILADMRPLIESRDHEVTALYFQAYAIAAIRSCLIDEGFEAFELALNAARIHGDPALCAKVLNNYGTASICSGRIDVAIAHLEEALEGHRRRASSVSIGLANLAEALFASGNLQRAAVLLHEFYAMEGEASTTIHCDALKLLIAAATVGILTGIMLPDAALLKVSRDATLLNLAFARCEQWLVGPIVEAFCTLYEREGRRGEHDALLARALDSLSSLENSLNLGIRAARLGPAPRLARIGALFSRQCDGTSSLLRAHSDLFESFIAARRGTADLAKDLGLQAASAFAREGRPFQQALALEAAGCSEGAEAVRRRCGARPESMRLRWSGAPIPRRLAAQLTPRESEIAHLVARGSKNRTIAVTLGLSERTVQHHCASIFGKLGIRSRSQLSAVINYVSEADPG
jgi:DNA-binding NarL/FixJ family response regulator